VIVAKECKIMSRASRQKGQRGEREICHLLADKLGGEYKRNLSQTQDGGYDVLGLEGFAVEVKFQETLSIERWWKQTVEQAGKDRVPVLFFRKSRTPWRVAIPFRGITNYVPCDKCSYLYYAVVPVDYFIENLRSQNV
jgi:hypothetical protein